MRTQHTFYRRRFLNRPKFQSGAHVIAEVERQVYNGNVDYYHTLRISDCNRVVSFDLSDSSSAERRNALFKLDTLISTLEDFREAVIESFEEIEEQERAKS